MTGKPGSLNIDHYTSLRIEVGVHPEGALVLDYSAFGEGGTSIGDDEHKVVAAIAGVVSRYFARLNKRLTEQEELVILRAHTEAVEAEFKELRDRMEENNRWVEGDRDGAGEAMATFVAENEVLKQAMREALEAHKMESSTQGWNIIREAVAKLKP